MLTVMFLLVFTNTFAQDFKAIEKMISKTDLDNAQVAIEELIKKEPAKPENYYLKYKVYSAINESEKFKKMVPDPLTQSWEGLKKFASMDKNFTALIKDNVLNIAEPFDNIRKKFIAVGSTNLDAKNYEASFTGFKSSLEVYKVFLDQKWTTTNLDTLIVFYTGYAAMNAKKNEDAEFYFKKLIDANASGPDLQIAYGWLAGYYIDTKKDSKLGLETAEKGLLYYPKDEFLLDQKSKAIAASGDVNAIFANHEASIAKPDAVFADYLKYAADLYDYLYADSVHKPDFELKQAKFEEVMGKGLAMKPTSAEGNYLMGFHHANIAVALDQKQKAIPAKSTKPEDIKKKADLKAALGKEIDLSIKYHDLAASIYRSKAANIKPNEKINYNATLKNLISFYKYKNNLERVKSLEEELKGLN
jgi:hypothetical protein